MEIKINLMSCRQMNLKKGINILLHVLKMNPEFKSNYKVDF